MLGVHTVCTLLPAHSHVHTCILHVNVLEYALLFRHCGSSVQVTVLLALCTPAPHRAWGLCPAHHRAWGLSLIPRCACGLSLIPCHAWGLSLVSCWSCGLCLAARALTGQNGVDDLQQLGNFLLAESLLGLGYHLRASDGRMNLKISANILVCMAHIHVYTCI